MKQLLSFLFIAVSINIFSQTISTPAQASNVTISNIGTGSFKISWTPPSSTGVIVVVKPVSSARSAPINASIGTYTGNINYGAGTNLGNANYIVYMGSNSTTNVTVTNLASDYNFEVIVYAYNFGCVQNLFICTQFGFLANSSYSASNSEAHYTLAPEPTVAPTVSVIGTPAATTATLSFNGTSKYNLVNVYNRNTASFNVPVDGTYYPASSVFGSGAEIGGKGTNNFAVYNNWANGTINLTNLTPATNYYGIVYSYNGSYQSSANNSYNYSNNYAFVAFSTYNSPPTINAISNYTLCQDALATNVDLSGISKGTNAAETQTVTVLAYSSNTALIPNPTINYSNPKPTGTLTFKPNAGQSGTALITLYVQDGGPNNSFTIKTFTVIVKGIPYPAGSISTATTTLCQQKTGVVFTTPAITNATSYNWSLPSGSTVTAGANTNAITVAFNTSVSSANIAVFGSNSNACGNGAWSPSLLVNFDKVPTTSNAGLNQQICNNLTALAANAPSVGIGSWSYSSTGLFNINPTSAYNANLTALDNSTTTAVWTVTNGVCPASSSTVVVNQIKGSPSCTPKAEFVANKTEACLNSTINFANTSVAAIGVNTYTWNFGSGATPATITTTNAIVPVTYSTVGLKTITLAMNGGAGLLTMTKNAYIAIITAPIAPSIITGNTLICQGKTAEPFSINMVSTATKYNWTFPNGVFQNTGGNTNVVSANFSTTATSGNIGVSAENVCGVSSITSLSVTANALPTQASAITGSATVCQGLNNVVYIANNLNNGLSYTWSTPNGANIIGGLNTKTITVDYDNSSSTSQLSVYATNGCGDGAIKTITITVNALPDAAGSVTGNVSNNICPLSSNINYSVAPIANATSYGWTYPNGYSVVGANNTNSLLLNASLNTSNGVITVIGKNSCGNGTSSPNLNVTINQLPAQQICVATVDSLSNHNEVFWQKNGISNVDSFRVYRVKSSLLDTLIGTVGYSDLSKFTDVTSNPNVTSYTYKIAAVDLCGHEGPKSNSHQTIHLQSIYSSGQRKTDLSWNSYVGATVVNYRVLRDTGHSNKWVDLISSLAPNVTSFTDLSIPANAKSVQYRVDVIWANACDPAARVSQSIVNTTKSNTKDFLIDDVTTSLEQTKFLNSIAIFPNPTKDYFDVEFSAGVESIDVEVYNQLGSKLKSNHFTYSDRITMDVSELSSGIYYVTIKTNLGTVTKRLSKL